MSHLTIKDNRSREELVPFHLVPCRATFMISVTGPVFLKVERPSFERGLHANAVDLSTGKLVNFDVASQVRLASCSLTIEG